MFLFQNCQTRGYNVARVINNLSASTQINHTIENNMVLVDTDVSIL